MLCCEPSYQRFAVAGEIVENRSATSCSAELRKSIPIGAWKVKNKKAMIRNCYITFPTQPLVPNGKGIDTLGHDIKKGNNPCRKP